MSLPDILRTNSTSCPGNLYYHFRNKDEIIHHLFAQFEKSIDIEPNPITDAASAMEDLWLYLHLMFERIWAYRFLYRNLNDLLARDAKLKSHFNIIVGHKRAAVVNLCQTLAGFEGDEGDGRRNPRPCPRTCWWWPRSGSTTSI